MADDTNITGGENGADLPEDLRRLLDRASAEDEGADVYVESDEDEDSDDDGELEEDASVADAATTATEATATAETTTAKQQRGKDEGARRDRLPAGPSHMERPLACK